MWSLVAFNNRGSYRDQNAWYQMVSDSFYEYSESSFKLHKLNDWVQWCRILWRILFLPPTQRKLYRNTEGDLLVVWAGVKVRNLHYKVSLEHTGIKSCTVPVVADQVLNTPYCTNRDFHDRIQICTAKNRTEINLQIIYSQFQEFMTNNNNNMLYYNCRHTTTMYNCKYVTEHRTSLGMQTFAQWNTTCEVKHKH